MIRESARGYNLANVRNVWFTVWGQPRSAACGRDHNFTLNPFAFLRADLISDDMQRAEHATITLATREPGERVERRGNCRERVKHASCWSRVSHAPGQVGD